jgi:hypothetical protein
MRNVSMISLNLIIYNDSYKKYLMLKKSQMIQAPRALCSGNHTIKEIYFCKRCAGEYDIHHSLDRVFFCAKCYGLSDHSKHMSDRFSVTAGPFL